MATDANPTSVVRITGASYTSSRRLWLILSVLAANSLVKREVFSLPDPFAVVSVDGDQTYTTNTIKRTLSPAWNQHFDM